MQNRLAIVSISGSSCFAVAVVHVPIRLYSSYRKVCATFTCMLVYLVHFITVVMFNLRPGVQVVCVCVGGGGGGGGNILSISLFT